MLLFRLLPVQPAGWFLPHDAWHLLLYRSADGAAEPATGGMTRRRSPSVSQNDRLNVDVTPQLQYIPSTV